MGLVVSLRTPTLGTEETSVGAAGSVVGALASLGGGGGGGRLGGGGGGGGGGVNVSNESALDLFLLLSRVLYAVANDSCESSRWGLAAAFMLYWRCAAARWLGSQFRAGAVNHVEMDFSS